jgi:hypothetical protein
MKNLNYNIAENKKVDVGKFAAMCTAFIVVSLLFFLLAGNSLWKNRQDRQKDIQELGDIKTKLQDINQKSQEYNREIEEIQLQWKRQVRFANSLVERKTYSMIEKLNILEGSLPAGVNISRLNLGSETKSSVTITVMAQTFQKLVEAYKNFARYNLNVKNENMVEGIYRANMTIFIKNEKD